MEESAQTIAELTERLKQYEADLERKESVSHSINTYKYTYLKCVLCVNWMIVNTTLTHSLLFKLPLMQEIPPPPPPGISMEEANELRENIEKLEGELVEMRAELAAKEDANNQLSKQGERGGGVIIILLLQHGV